MLEHLNEVNDVKVYSVFDPAFKPFGNIVEGYDFTDIVDYMKNETGIPRGGNTYVASVEGT